MGKLEKLVVLAVLFTAALVLAISFNRGGDEVEASDPMSGARQVLGDSAGSALAPVGQAGLETGAEKDASATPPVVAPTSAQQSGEPATSLLLNAGDESELHAPMPAGSSTLAIEPESDPSHTILVDRVGLRPSFLGDYMMYTVVEGDTWSSLAQRFYQDGRYTRNLHIANEDLQELTPGKDVLVPVYDFIAVDAGLQPGAGVVSEESAERAASFAAAPPRSQPGATPTTSTREGLVREGNAKQLEYEVRTGDTLSDISVAVFGTATRWQEILDANKDKLQKPESLQVGMKLKIPAGGKLPAPAKAASSTAKKPESKPKTAAPADKTAATPKKKKVL